MSSLEYGNFVVVEKNLSKPKLNFRFSAVQADIFIRIIVACVVEDIRVIVVAVDVITILILIIVRFWVVLIARCGKQFVLGIIHVIEGIFLSRNPVLKDLIALFLDPYVAEFDLWS